MRHAVLAVLCATTVMSNAALAQRDPPGGGEIKALSAQDVAQYLAGAGLSYAKAAELNHFPGPVQVLELADKLGLTPEQRVAVARLADALRAEARYLGARLVQAERALDALFRRGAVGPEALAEAVRAAAALEGEYRLSHLDAHRRTRAILSGEQVDRYDELRGYVGRTPADDDLHRH